MTETASHLDDDALVALVEGRADPASRARIEAHAASCVPCRELLSALARQEGATESSERVGKPAALEVMAGAQVGRYVLTRLVGAGGMGMVFAARDPELDRTVAVKLLFATTAGEEAKLAQQERLRREAQVMAKLSHPNVAAVHDVGMLGDRLFVAMEYVEGVNLAEWLATPRALPEILAVFGDAARGLAAAHAQGVVHRDFKPENVIVGDDGRVRVVDFGIAKRVGPASESATKPLGLTATNSAIGTPFYMAPEQYLGEPVDGRADQFSFCVALYAAVYGVRPFAGDTLDELIATALRGQLTPPPAPERVPAKLRRALERGLGAVPDTRFPTMEALLAALVVDPPRRRPYFLVIAGVVLAGAGVTAFALTRHGEPAPASHDFTASSAITNVQHAPGLDLAPVWTEPAPPDALGSALVASTWCAPRDAAVLVTAYGRILTVTRTGEVTTLATIAGTTKPLGSAVACLATGRIVGVIRGTPFALERSAVLAVGTAPPNVIDAVAVGTTARWLTAGAVWEWNGSDAPRQLRTTCAKPLRLAPDGERVACRRDERIVVDTGSAELEGPAGTSASWSRDGRALYVAEASVIRRWVLGARKDGELVGGGTVAFELGSWAVTKNGAQLVLHWIGPDPARQRAPIELGPSARVALLAVALPPSVVLLAHGSQGLRLVDLDRPVAPPPVDRHLSSILALAFTPDGLVTLGTDRRLIHHALADHARTLVGELAQPVPPDAFVTPRADGSYAIGANPSSGTFAAATFTPFPADVAIGAVLGSPDL
ncbi:MAG: protein kinase, partial [Kofleriaceae bacterium]